MLRWDCFLLCRIIEGPAWLCYVRINMEARCCDGTASGCVEISRAQLRAALSYYALLCCHHSFWVCLVTRGGL